MYHFRASTIAKRRQQYEREQARVAEHLRPKPHQVMTKRRWDRIASTTAGRQANEALARSLDVYAQASGSMMFRIRGAAGVFQALADHPYLLDMNRAFLLAKIDSVRWDMVRQNLYAQEQYHEMLAKLETQMYRVERRFGHPSLCALIVHRPHELSGDVARLDAEVRTGVIRVGDELQHYGTSLGNVTGLWDNTKETYVQEAWPGTSVFMTTNKRVKRTIQANDALVKCL